MNEESLFHQALQQADAAARAAFLDRACANQPQLRAHIEKLLQAHDAPVSLFDQPAAEAVTGDEVSPGRWIDPADPRPSEGPGSRIGPYKLLQQIGAGGMGVVFMAEQQEPVRRMVALKVIKAGMDTAQVIARFEAERQALALMDHQNIARVLDAGTTASGRPFFVMELVKGIPITKFCDDNHLTPHERLELFVPVCQAIQHAHQKGIIHRDVKPSNVLVALYDGNPVPKVIDFGVAKAIEQRLTERTLFTQFGQVVGTLEYMSPEQAEHSALDIDTRSDIYSLGVLLYELLTGSTPLEKKRLRQVAFHEMLRMIREEEPPRPSMRLSDSRDQLATISAQRKMEPAKLTKLVRGELDWLVMKALEKDRTRRYETASDFAADVQRYLHDEAVLACPPSLSYRLGKFARKHRGLLTAVTAFVLLLAAAAAVSTWLAVRAMQAEVATRQERDDKEQARQAAVAEQQRAEKAEALAKTRLEEVSQQKARADEEAKIATAVNRFLRLLLSQADIGLQPRGAARNPNVTVQELLDRAARSIEGQFADQPRTEAAIRGMIGDAYLALGRYAQAQQHLERAVQLRTAELGADHPETLSSKNHLAMLYRYQGQYAKAEPLLKEVLESQTAKLGADQLDTLNSKNELATLYRDLGQYAKAEPLIKEALEGFTAKWGANHPLTLHSKNELALLYLNQGQYAKAEPLFKELLQSRTARWGADHPSTLTVKNNLAGLYYSQRQYAKAEPLLKEAVQTQTAKLGADHPNTLNSKYNLATLYQAQRQYAKAESLFKEALQGQTAKLGADHPRTLNSKNHLAELYQAQGQHAQAEPLLRELLASWKHKAGADSLPYAGQLAALASNLLRQQKADDAEPILRECLAIRQKKQPDVWTTFNTQSMLGDALLRRKKYADAEPLLKAGYQGMKQREAAIPAPSKAQRLSEALQRLVQLYEATGNKDEAVKWRKELEEVKEAATKKEAKP